MDFSAPLSEVGMPGVPRDFLSVLSRFHLEKKKVEQVRTYKVFLLEIKE